MTTDLLTPIVDDATRRQLLAGVAAGLLTGCGSAQRPLSVEPQTREITHAQGATAVPTAPTRAFLTNVAYLPVVVALGLDDLLVGYADFGAELPDYVTRRLGREIPLLGQTSDLPFEAIVAARPDLIINDAANNADAYPTLSEIAPTVSLGANDTVDDPVREFAEQIATIFGRPEIARRLEARRQEQLDTARAELGDVSGVSVSMIEPYGGGFSPYNRSGAEGRLLRDLGFARPPAQDVDGDGSYLDPFMLSLERLSEHDGDFLLVVSTSYAEAGDVDAVLSSPLYAVLSAVRAGRVAVVNDVPWRPGDHLALEEALRQAPQVFARVSR